MFYLECEIIIEKIVDEDIVVDIVVCFVVVVFNNYFKYFLNC